MSILENKIKKVNSYEEISKLIFLNFKKDVITNNFISKEDFENEINQGKLYYISFEKGLFILRDRGDFFILNYYLRNVLANEIIDIIHNLINKSLVVEIVGKSEEDLKYLKAIDIFTNLGMKEAVKRERFSKKKNEEVGVSTDNKHVGNVSNEDVNVEYCEINDFVDIHELLNSNFNKYYGCIPSVVSIKEDIISNNFYKAVLDNRIVGLLHIKKPNNSSEIRHLVVDKLYRNRGIANALIQKYDNDISVNKTVWTGKDNISAQKIYERNGYARDGYLSTVLILEND